MGQILGRFLLPHPPAALPEIGKEQKEKISKTTEGFRRATQRIADLRPETIIVITPHGPCFDDHFYMPSPQRISGDFSAFGVKKVLMGFDNDTELVQIIHRKAAEKKLSAGTVDDRTMKQNGISYDLDHGVLVPLYFVLSEYRDFKLVPVSLSGLSGKEHYLFGMALRDAVREYDKDVIIIASGDLSHKVSEESPYRFDESGPVFDKTVRKLLLDEDVRGFLTFDPELKEKAAQCGLDSYRILLGTLDGFDFFTNIHSYEAPFGIGYLTAEITAGKPRESAFFRYLAEEKEILKKRMEQESEPVKLARAAAEEYLQSGKEMAVPESTPAFLKKNRGGVFVCFKQDGRLRGCIGTTSPTCPGLAMEIIANAGAAAARDPRFSPILLEELDEMTITVDILEKPEEIKELSQLNPKKYGIIVENRGRSAVLLPDLDGIDTVEEQIRAAREKAGIHPWHKLNIKRFSVTRYQ